MEKKTIDRYFTRYKSYKSKGSVLIMSGLSRSKPDYRDLITVACFFARLGYTALVLAPVHYKDPLYHEVFSSLIGTPYYRKCPDLMIDGVFFEYESYERPFKSRKISHMISRGSEQAERIIIDNNKGASDRFIINRIINRLKDKHFKRIIKEVFVYEKGEVRRIFYNKKIAVGSVSSPRSTNP